LYHNSNKMRSNKLKVMLTEEAQTFLDAQSFKARQKIYYNIFLVEKGMMKVDIFKNVSSNFVSADFRKKRTDSFQKSRSTRFQKIRAVR